MSKAGSRVIADYSLVRGESENRKVACVFEVVVGLRRDGERGGRMRQGRYRRGGPELADRGSRCQVLLSSFAIDGRK